MTSAATVPFFITLRFNEERVIAETGALELRARCTLGSGTSGDTLELVVTSELDGWFATRAGSSSTRPKLADDEVVLFTARGRPGEDRLSGFAGDQLGGAQIALAPDGSFIALDSGSTALGVDLFAQDCLAVGTATLIRGALPAPPAFGDRLEPPDRISGSAAIGDRLSRSTDRFSDRSDDGIQFRLRLGN